MLPALSLHMANSAFDFASLGTELFTCHKISQMKFNNDISPIELVWNSPALHSNRHPS